MWGVLCPGDSANPTPTIFPRKRSAHWLLEDIGILLTHDPGHHELGNLGKVWAAALSGVRSGPPVHSRAARQRSSFPTSSAAGQTDQPVYELDTLGILPEPEDVLAEVHMMRYFVLPPSSSWQV